MFIPDSVSAHDNVYDVLQERGFIEQTTDDEAVRELLGKKSIKFYIGFDPTADCLHIGHFMQVIIMMYMQKYGHTPIVLIGGGTGMVGDPSGRTDMRMVMNEETVQHNCNQFKKLFDKYIDFDDSWEYHGRPGVIGNLSKQEAKELGFAEIKEPAKGKAVAVNNASWLLPLKYVDFIREVGTHFSVNNMLRAECFKQRMDKGLSFFEFNYMLMQGYDFAVMARDLDCEMEFGGNDQWSNIIAGVDLSRKMMNKQVYGMTFSLLTTSEGVKMGKTQKGALWLDAERTGPYDFFQYWRNVEDADVNKCLRMLTFLPMDEVNRLSALKDAEINKAKEILAYEVTKLVHGEAEAEKALAGARAAFGGGKGASVEDMPTTAFSRDDFAGEGMGLINLIKELGLVKSNGEGFRTVEQGGLSINGEKVADAKMKITADNFDDGKLILKKGKKTFHVVKLKE